MHSVKVYNSSEVAFTLQDIEEADKRIAEEFGKRLSDAIEMYMLRTAIVTFFNICVTFKSAKKIILAINKNNLYTFVKEKANEWQKEEKAGNSPRR
jgi:hypothetical protein